jgi:hypothetical protein
VNKNKCNENKYTDNNNNLLFILLLLIFLRCDKAGNKCKTLSNTLNEEYVPSEDTYIIPDGSKTTSKRFEREKVKSYVEKDKIEMFIRDLENNAKQIIDLEEVNEENEEQEKLEELNKEKLEDKLVKDIEAASKLFIKEKDKAYTEKINIEMLIKDLESNIEPSINFKEVNGQTINAVEEIKPQELGKEKPDNNLISNLEEALRDPEKNKVQVYIEEPKTETILKELEPNTTATIKLKEDNEQKLELLGEKKLKEIYNEKLENESLEQLDKKDLAVKKNLARVFRGSDTMPMEIILKQLVGENIALSIISKGNGFIANATLLSVKDGIVHVDNSSRILSIPIGDIVGVNSNLINAIELQPLTEASREEDYKYKEWSLGNLFSTMIGGQVSIETIGPGSFNNISNKVVTNVGQGIVVIESTMAVSLSKIILVERR